MSDFICKVKKALDSFNMLNRGDSVIIALSGGADSVSLLNVLLSLKKELSLNLYASHVNHNLRGDEAQRDEDFVKALCNNHNIELFVKSVDVRSLAKKRGQSEELCGRNVRYEFFSRLSERLNAKIATAHTASDNAETVIFNLARGAGLNGLSGIAPVRDNIIRPLIYVTRDDVGLYCKENSLKYVTDSTNLSDEYTRNRIRHSVIPVLKELNPDFENTVIREGELLRGVNSYIELKTNEVIDRIKVLDGYDCSKLASLPEALRLSVIRSICRINGAESDYKLAKLIDASLGGGAVALGGGFRAVCKQGTLRLTREGKIKYFSELELKEDTAFIYNQKEYSVKELKAPSDNLVFRTRRAGDTFKLPKRNVTKTIKKLFNELKIPEEKRDYIMLAANGSQILWIEGIGASEDASGKLKINVRNL